MHRSGTIVGNGALGRLRFLRMGKQLVLGAGRWRYGRHSSQKEERRTSFGQDSQSSGGLRSFVDIDAECSVVKPWRGRIGF